MGGVWSSANFVFWNVVVKLEGSNPCTCLRQICLQNLYHRHPHQDPHFAEWGFLDAAGIEPLRQARKSLPIFGEASFRQIFTLRQVKNPLTEGLPLSWAGRAVSRGGFAPTAIPTTPAALWLAVLRQATQVPSRAPFGERRQLVPSAALRCADRFWPLELLPHLPANRSAG